MRQRICKNIAFLLAIVALGGGSAWAQICQATADDEDVRAEGITETVGNLTISCRPDDSGFGLLATDDVVIEVTLNTQITNLFSSNNNATIFTIADASAPTADEMEELDAGKIGVTATARSAAITATFDTAKLSEDGTTLEWEIDDASTAALDGATVANGFVLVISGLRANASSVGAGEDVMATVMVNGTVARRSPTKVADVMTGLDVTVKRQNGTICAVPGEDVKATITIKEGKDFEEALQNDTDLVLTFSDVPDGAMVLVMEKLGGAVTGGTDETVGSGDDDVTAAALTLATAGRGSGVTKGTGDYKDYYVVDLSRTGVGEITYNYTTGSTQTGADTSDATGRDSSVDTLPVIEVKVVWDENDVAEGMAWVNVSYDPVSNVMDASMSGDKIPRYVMTADSPEFLRVSDCDTSMMFPFVTNQAGFETGIALTNPSEADGSCMLDFVAGGEVAMDHMVEVDAMSTVAFSLSGVASGFQGHIKASCDFMEGSAFVFIDNGAGMGGPTAAQGYILTAE